MLGRSIEPGPQSPYLDLFGSKSGTPAGTGREGALPHGRRSTVKRTIGLLTLRAYATRDEEESPPTSFPEQERALPCFRNSLPTLLYELARLHARHRVRSAHVGALRWHRAPTSILVLAWLAPLIVIAAALGLGIAAFARNGGPGGQRPPESSASPARTIFAAAAVLVAAAATPAAIIKPSSSFAEPRGAQRTLLDYSGTMDQV
jgi:hypothetical protein